MSRERQEDMKRGRAGRRDNVVPERRRQRPSGNDAPSARKDTRFAASIPWTAGETGERIAKRLARAGIASRREAETIIAAGRVAVNGHVLTTPAVNVEKTDVITVDGKPLPQAERTRLWLYHKPSGLVTTMYDPEGRPTVFDSLPDGLPRVLSVGRLDISTEGLLLLTNDGGLSRILELPSTGWARHYRVRAHGKISQAELDSLKNGIAVDGVFYGAVEASIEREQGSNVWLSVTLHEGKNREIKNILGALGLTVARLIRVSFGPFQLDDLGEGMVREIRGRTLRDQLGKRLIAEANADFDSLVVKVFSNAPVAAASRGEKRPRETMPGKERDWISSGGGRRRQAGSCQDSDARAKLTARPFEERKEHRNRIANVWMAPGARPARGRSRTGYQPRERPLERNEEERGTSHPRSRQKNSFSPHAYEGRPDRRSRSPDRQDGVRDRYEQKDRRPKPSVEGGHRERHRSFAEGDGMPQRSRGARRLPHPNVVGKGGNRRSHPPVKPRGGRNADRRR